MLKSKNYRDRLEGGKKRSFPEYRWQSHRRAKWQECLESPFSLRDRKRAGTLQLRAPCAAARLLRFVLDSQLVHSAQRSEKKSSL